MFSLKLFKALLFPHFNNITIFINTTNTFFHTFHIKFIKYPTARISTYSFVHSSLNLDDSTSELNQAKYCHFYETSQGILLKLICDTKAARSFSGKPEKRKPRVADPSAIDFDAFVERPLVHRLPFSQSISCARGRRHDPEKEVVRLHGQSSETRCL